MRRREFLCLVGGAAAWPATAHAQQEGKVYRVGIFSTSARSKVWHLHQALIDSLRELGFVEGRNVIFENRFAEGKMERLAGIAAELVALRPDVIVAGPNTTVRAVSEASSTIPIVTTYSADPVASGFAASLARPGGNITGLTSDVTDQTYTLRLQLLKEINPITTHVAALWNPDAIKKSALQATEDAAERLGITVASHEARNIGDLESVFSSLSKGTSNGMVVFSDGLTYARRQDIVDFAARVRLPTIYGSRESVDDGGLISYAVSLVAIYRRTANFVAKILKGARPGDLPIELPTVLELVINLKTAKALGLVVPQSLLLRADEVID